LGTNGSSGTSGKDGTFFGSSGTSGTSGAGTSGTSGTSGLGTSGTSGVNGTFFGSSGTSGTSGTSGAGSSGTSGVSGTNGTSGSSGFLNLSGTTDNGIITWNNPLSFGNVESNLTFDGSTLSVTGNIENSGYVTSTTYRETYSDLGTGGSVTLDLSTANNFRRQFNATATITISNAPGAPRAFGFTLTAVNAGAHVITWPASIDWVSGTAPILTSAGTDVLTFFTFNGGTTYYGFVVGKNMS
jgi:hypothetical protein